MTKKVFATVKEVRNFSSKMPRNIHEALNFNETEDMSSFDTEEPMEKPEAEKTEMHSDGGMDVMAFVDDIRKKSLKGMAQLADNPDDERYQLLKKIWQICDKKPEQQTAFSNPNQQQGQNPRHGMA